MFLGAARLATLLVLGFATDGSAPSAESRVVDYLQTHFKEGEPVAVTKLYNEVFTSAEEHAVLNRLFNDFFKIPLFAAQYQQLKGKPPSLRDISDRFHFEVPGEAALLLKLAESDPRVPRFLTRDPRTGEITSIDVPAIMGDARFGRELERTIGGFEGRQAPRFSLTTWGGETVASDSLAGKPYVLYFWFSGCPPCMKTAPLLAALDAKFAPQGLRIVGVNADRVLELPDTDESRAAYVRKVGIRFTEAHMSPEMQKAFGNVSVFPTLFFVDKHGVVVQELVSFQETKELEGAVRLALGS